MLFFLTQAGLETPLNGLATPMTDFKQIGEAREKVLKLKIDQVSHGCIFVVAAV
jgi:hypothetical protein